MGPAGAFLILGLLAASPLALAEGCPPVFVGGIGFGKAFAFAAASFGGEVGEVDIAGTNDTKGLLGLRLSPTSLDRFISFGAGIAYSDYLSRFSVELYTYAMNPDPRGFHRSPSPLLATGLYDDCDPGPWFAPLAATYSAYGKAAELGRLFAIPYWSVCIGASLPAFAGIAMQNSFHESIGLAGYDWYDKPAYPIAGIAGGLVAGIRSGSDAFMLGARAGLGAGSENALALGAAFSGGTKAGPFAFNLYLSASVSAGFFPQGGTAIAAMGSGLCYGLGLVASVSAFGLSAHYGLGFDAFDGASGERYETIRWTIGFGAAL
jgi:hypothetical protein